MSEDLSPEAARAEVLDPLMAARRLVGLVEGAESVGLLDALKEEATPAEGARATGLDEWTVSTMLDALEAGDVVERDGDRSRSRRRGVSLAVRVRSGRWAQR